MGSSPVGPIATDGQLIPALVPAEEGLRGPRVFLLSTFNLEKYDFQQLQEAMVQGLASHKRRALLVAMPNVSKNILEKKAAVLRQHIWLVALVACSINQGPVPGVKDVACDLAMLTRCLQGYRSCLGLDTGLQGEAKDTINQAQVVELLRRAVEEASAFTHELLRVPILGNLTTQGISFGAIYQMLRRSLDMAVKEAQDILAGPDC